MTTEFPGLSEGTAAAVANLIDYEIEREHGADVATAIQGATMVALAGLQFDLREQFQIMTGSGDGLRGYAETELRTLVRDGLAKRACQCREIHPHGCPHGSASGSIFCGGHYEVDVPAISGALLCGTCHVAEYQARSAQSPA